MIGRRDILGLSIADDAIVAALLSTKSGRWQIVSAARLSVTGELSWKDPDALGTALGDLLHRKRMPRKAVVGIPSHWLMSVRLNVPPASRDAVTGILRLGAERAVSLPPDQLAFDVADLPPEDEAGMAVLFGASRDRLETIRRMLAAAGVTASSITSCIAPLALCRGEAASELTLCAMSDGIEIAATPGGCLKSLKHISPTGAENTLAIEVSALLNEMQSSEHRAAIWSAPEPTTLDLKGICAAVGCAVETDPDLPFAGLKEAASSEAISTGELALAAALACGGFDSAIIPFDLLHSRLETREKPHWQKPAAWATAVAVAVLLGLGVLFADQRATQTQNAELAARLSDMAASIESAREVVQGVTLAREWYSRRPPHLDCLRELTLSFPKDGGIYATGLAVREDMRGVLSGKASNDQLVLALLDALQRNKSLSEVRPLYLRESRAASQEKTFAISFRLGQSKEGT
jgi:hypothetical protein